MKAQITFGKAVRSHLFGCRSACQSSTHSFAYSLVSLTIVARFVSSVKQSNIRMSVKETARPILAHTCFLGFFLSFFAFIFRVAFSQMHLYRCEFRTRWLTSLDSIVPVDFVPMTSHPRQSTRESKCLATSASTVGNEKQKKKKKKRKVVTAVRPLHGRTKTWSCRKLDCFQQLTATLSPSCLTASKARTKTNFAKSQSSLQGKDTFWAGSSHADFDCTRKPSSSSFEHIVSLYSRVRAHR